MSYLLFTYGNDNVVVSIKYIHNFDKFDPYFCLIVNKHKRRENV